LTRLIFYSPAGKGKPLMKTLRLHISVIEQSIRVITNKYLEGMLLLLSCHYRTVKTLKLNRFLAKV